MNAAVAAAAGALTDLDPEPDSDVATLIFRHPNFERLEAEGDAKLGAALRLVKGRI
jgi:hypothetical protein